MTTRKFYKTVIQVTILSEGPYVLDEVNNGAQLSAIAADIYTGPCVGDIKIIAHNEEKTGKEMADLLVAAASDPGFSMLTDEGKDTEEIEEG